MLGGKCATEFHPSGTRPSPYRIGKAVEQIEKQALPLLAKDKRVIAVAWDHAIALPMLQPVHKVHGSVSQLHFDAHPDT